MSSRRPRERKRFFPPAGVNFSRLAALIPGKLAAPCDAHFNGSRALGGGRMSHYATGASPAAVRSALATAAFARRVM
jgi:hypothetical protein